jgi:hypothetical protein
MFLSAPLGITVFVSVGVGNRGPPRVVATTEKGKKPAGSRRETQGFSSPGDRAVGTI